MRDYKNIICDVNNENYKMYNESNLNFDKLNKKQLLIYMFNLIYKCNNYIYNNKNNSHVAGYNRKFYATNNIKISFNYAYRIYSRQQILEAITTILFNFKAYLVV